MTAGPALTPSSCASARSITDTMASVPDLRVHVTTPEKEQFRGRCTDLDSSRDEVIAHVEFAPNQAPAIRLGERTQLSFRGGGLVANIDSEALTILRADERNRRCYSFCLNAIPKGMLLILANRRHAKRVRPSAANPVSVLLLDVSGSAVSQSVVHDISAKGLSIIVDPVLEEQLFDKLQVRLSILLPTSRGSLEVVATIRNRRLCGSKILYGLELDAQQPDFARAQEQIGTYLANLHSTARPRT
jgi:PilZ domain-containing protein